MQPVLNVMADLRDTYHLTPEEVATVAASVTGRYLEGGGLA